MNDEGILLFEFDVKRQTRLALHALNRLRTARSDDAATVEAIDAFRDETDMAFVTFLSATASVSRLLWPGRSSRMPTRGPILRAIFDVADNSPLRDRWVRNRIEHHDEDLEKFVMTHPVDIHRPYGLPIGLRHLGDGKSVSRFIVQVGREERDMTPHIEELRRIRALSENRVVGNRIYLLRPDLASGSFTG